MLSPTVISILLLSGVCALAGINHLTSGLRRPRDHSQIVFSLYCFIMMVFAISQAQGYHVENMNDFVLINKWNVTTIMLSYCALTWFVYLYTGQMPLYWSSLSTLILGTLIVINWQAPFGLQYEQIDSIDRIILPWGESINQVRGTPGTRFAAAAFFLLFNLLICLFLLGRKWRRQNHLDLLLIATFIIYLICSTQGIMVRSGQIEFIHLGPFGILLLLLVISYALNNRIRNELEQTRQRIHSLMQQAPVSIQVYRPDGSLEEINPAGERLWGISSSEMRGYNILNDPQLQDSEAMPAIRKGFSGHAANVPAIRYNSQQDDRNDAPGNQRWVRSLIYPIKDRHQKIQNIMLVQEDVTLRKRTDEAIRLIAEGVAAVTGELFFRRLVVKLAQVLDAEHAFVGTLNDNSEVEVLAGWSQGDFIDSMSYSLDGTPCNNVMTQTTCIYPDNVQEEFPGDHMLVDMGARSYAGTLLYDASQKAIGILVVLDSKPFKYTRHLKNILEIFAARAGAEMQRQQSELRIRSMAYRDFLTNLGSRDQFSEWLKQVNEKAQNDNLDGALLLINLDNFKTINDALGHQMGDELLRAVAARLLATVGSEGLIARPGSDEYLVIMHQTDEQKSVTSEQARTLADRILSDLRQPLTLGDQELSITASIGIAMISRVQDTEPDILRHANMALQRAKDIGRSSIQFFIPEFQQEANDKHRIAEGLRRALENGSLYLHFQPQCDQDGKITGAETLLRWQHPELGNITPDVFIPVAEETGLIHGIGSWVLDRACASLARWCQSETGFSGHLSVNVSPWQFALVDFVDDVRDVINRHAIPPEKLMLELTETVLLHDLQDAIVKLTALRALGVGISLDDFGTGYSSLAYLRDLPLDQIKIDKAFVDDVENTEDSPLLASMIAIGRTMNLTVIAEGVETRKQLSRLEAMGCHFFQGFLFSRPVAENTFLDYCRQPHLPVSQVGSSA